MWFVRSQGEYKTNTKQNKTCHQVISRWGNSSTIPAIENSWLDSSFRILKKFQQSKTKIFYLTWFNGFYYRLCLVCTVKTQTVNEFQEFACKHLKMKTPWDKCSWRKIFHSDDLSLFNLYLVKYISGLKWRNTYLFHSLSILCLSGEISSKISLY